EFQVMGEMPNIDGDQGVVPEEPTGIQKYLKWIIGGGVAVAVAAGIIVAKKIRKRKKNREMEIDLDE
ncbi:MAG: hypothetical protein RR361_08540, partial [Anaerovorax sp.]